jgi:hypothetical protein
MEELDITALLAVPDDESPDLGPLVDAIGAASSQDQVTWLTDQGKRVAAIVPPDVAEAHEKLVERAMSAPAGKLQVRYPQVTAFLSVGHDASAGAILATVTRAMKAAGVDEGDIRRFREAVFGCRSYSGILQLVVKTVNVE